VLLVRVAGGLTAETGPRLLGLLDGLLDHDGGARPRAELGIVPTPPALPAASAADGVLAGR
jgi:hypothetical protein